MATDEVRPVRLKTLVVIDRQRQLHVVTDVGVPGKPLPLEAVSRLLPGAPTRVRLAPAPALGELTHREWVSTLLREEPSTPPPPGGATSVAMLPALTALEETTVVECEGVVLSVAELAERASRRGAAVLRLTNEAIETSIRNTELEKQDQERRRAVAAKISAAAKAAYVPSYLKTPLLQQLADEAPPVAGSSPSPAPEQTNERPAPIMAAAAAGSMLDLATLRLSDQSALVEAAAAPERPLCPRCGRHGRYYCNHDLTVLTSPGPPRVALPFKLVVVKHNAETIGKSTAVHARLVAPDHTELLAYPSSSLAEDVGRVCAEGPTAILYPSKDADDVGTMSLDRLAALRAIVVLDGTWHNVKPMLNDPALSSLPRIALPRTEARTSFWRLNHRQDPHLLSTIEAVYVLCRTIDARLRPNVSYDGRYDDLLWYFAHLQRVVGDIMLERKRKRDAELAGSDS